MHMQGVNYGPHDTSNSLLQAVRHHTSQPIGSFREMEVGANTRLKKTTTTYKYMACRPRHLPQAGGTMSPVSPFPGYAAAHDHDVANAFFQW